MKLSVCIITKEESEQLKRCLASLKKYDMEIVVVDTGSVDKTKQVIDEYADIGGYYQWNDNFAAARNYSITLASNDWVLILDSDEWIESIDADKVNSIIMQIMDESMVGRIERINDISSLEGSTKGIERISRLFNRKYCQYVGRIHEQIESVNKNIKYIDIPIIIGHSGYSGDLQEKKKKAERNIRLLKMDLEEQGPSAYTYYQLGKSYYMQGNYEKASENFEQGLSFDLNPKLEYVQDMVETYGYSLLNQKRFSEMMFLENIYKEFALSPDYVFLMGLAYMNNGFYYNIGVIYECLGYKDKAMESYKLCGKYDLALKGISRLG